MKNTCDRCGQKTDTLYPCKFTDDYGEKHDWEICWDCDWEITNGDEIMKDDYDIYMDRKEREYEEDPVNTPYPWW